MKKLFTILSLLLLLSGCKKEVENKSTYPALNGTYVHDYYFHPNDINYDKKDYEKWVFDNTQKAYRYVLYWEITDDHAYNYQKKPTEGYVKWWVEDGKLSYSNWDNPDVNMLNIQFKYLSDTSFEYYYRVFYKQR